MSTNFRFKIYLWAKSSIASNSFYDARRIGSHSCIV